MYDPAVPFLGMYPREIKTQKTCRRHKRWSFDPWVGWSPGACQAPLSMELSRQEYWSGLPCPPPGDLPDPGVKAVSLMSPALAGGSLPLHHLGSPWWTINQALKSTEVLIHATTCMYIESRLNKEVSHNRTHTVWFYSYETSKIGKFTEKESQLVISWGEREMERDGWWVWDFFLG